MGMDCSSFRRRGMLGLRQQRGFVFRAHFRQRLNVDSAVFNMNVPGGMYQRCHLCAVRHATTRSGTGTRCLSFESLVMM